MKIKTIALTFLIAAAAVAGSAGMVQADEHDEVVAEQKQECKQKVEQECEAGAYGQITNCELKAEQVCEQEQKVVVRDEGEVLGKEHEPVDTALDLKTMLAAAGILSTGAGAYALKRKIA